MQTIQNARKRFDCLQAVSPRIVQQDDAAIVSLLLDSSQDNVCPGLRPILRIDILQDHEVIEILRDFQRSQLTKVGRPVSAA